MSSPRRHSPAVYRRRRLVALLVALLVVGAIVAGVWVLIAQPWQSAAGASPAPSASDSAVSIPAPNTGGSTPSAAPTPDAGVEPGVDASAVPSGEPTAEPSEEPGADASASATPAPGATAPVIAACEREDVTVEPVLDSDSYGTDQLPQMSIRLTNVSDEDCAMNVGTTHQVYTISSGTDVWWRSTDCQKEPSDMIVTLAAGQVVESAEPLAWDRTRSSVSTCDGQRPAAVGGGATYTLTVSLGGVAGTGSAQFLLF